MSVDHQQITRAKQACLPEVLAQLGLSIQPNGRAWCCEEHNSLKFFQHQGIWLYKWYSKGGEVGDSIQFLRRYYSMSFHQALEILTEKNISDFVQWHCPVPLGQPRSTWRDQSWQDKSARLIRFAQNGLLSCSERMNYLNSERGMTDKTIKQYQLGWLPEKKAMPEKLLIPCYSLQGQLFRIRFRIDTPPNKGERYRVSSGSNTALPFPLKIISGLPVIIVESELDALLITQQINIGVLALGTTAVQLTSKMIHYLKTQIPIILISLDNDQSGYNKTKELLHLLRKAKNWPVPKKYGKDPGEVWNKINLKQWIENGL